VTLDLEQLYKVYPLYRELFYEQLRFVLDPSRFKAAQCTRRAGKTKGAGIGIVQKLINTPDSLYLYLALTDKTVEDIFMPAVRSILTKYKIVCQVNKDAIIFPNGSKLLLAGANHINKIETFRGFKLLGCTIDEAASFDDTILTYLIDEIIAPALLDQQGQLEIVGTPASHCSGMFYDATTKPSDIWTVHKWSGVNNPFIAENFKKDMQLFMKRKKCDENNAKFRREFLGEWCADTDELMIKPFKVVERVEYNQDSWRTVVGVDIGFNDETAVTVIGWKYNNPKAFILRSIGFNASTVNDVDGVLSRLAKTLIQVKEVYKPSTIVVDYAGGSKVIMDHLSRKYHVHVENAEKTNKAHYIELMNDALLNDELVLVDDETTELQAEMKKLVWNDDHTREKEGVKCDRVDATLYAYRAALHFLEKIEVVVPIDAFALSKQMEQQAIEQWHEREDGKRPDRFYDDLAAELNNEFPY
jgi:terminase large subunit-like protein